MGHYGYFKTIDSYTDASRHVEDSERHIDLIEQERSWVGVSDSPGSWLRDIQWENQTPQQNRIEMAIRLKKAQAQAL